MATALSLVNRALVRLGAEKISALTPEDSPNAVTAIELYDSIRDELLAEHPWSFATRRLQLSRLDVPVPAREWAEQYALPNAALKIWRVCDDSGTTLAARYDLQCDEESGYRRLYTDQTVAYADITMTSPEELFPAWFQAALVARLAAEFAMPITRNTQLASYYASLAVLPVARAKAHDWNERPTPMFDDGDNLLNARFGG